jgi:RND family efflux transporter MFP subunit
MTTSKKMLLGALALGLAIVAYVYFSRPTVLVARVTSGTAYKAVPGSVIVQAKFEMELKSEVSGRVVKSELDPGKPVAAGDVLAQLDTGDLELEITGIRAKYESEKRRIAVGSAIHLQLQSELETLENFERLTKSGNYPEAELIKQRRLVKRTEQSAELEKVANQQLLDYYENILKVKQRQLGKMTITVPFEGVVSEVRARPGDLIGANSPIAKIIATSRTVEAKISEENFADLKTGQKASVRFLPYGVGHYDATVVKILPTSDPLTQRYLVHLEVKIADDKLVPGITGEVSIVVGERKAKANVPRRALFGSNLYVVKDGRVELRKVELGYTSLTTVEVLKGVGEGEEVIVDEIDRFRDGDRVRANLVSTD